MASVRTDKYRRFRRLLVELRTEAGLTQAELASRLEKPQSFVSKIERGERRLDLVEFEGVAKALGADPIQVISQFFAQGKA